MVIQHNIPALNSHRNLGINNAFTSKNLEKLSSGYKINRAGDDAAGLAISEKMRGQIRGLAMAEQNTSNGVSLIQTAEGGLNETHAILQRMRELSVQSSNGTYQDEDREQITLEFNALKSEIDRIAESTHYNGIKLLNGNLEYKELVGNAHTASTIATADIKTGIQANIFGDGTAKSLVNLTVGGTGVALSAATKLIFSLDENGKLSVTNDGSNATVSDLKLEDGTLSFKSAAKGATTGTMQYSLGGISEERLTDVLNSLTGGSFTLTIADDGTMAATGAAITSTPTLKALTAHTGLTSLGVAITNGTNGAHFGKQDVTIARTDDGNYKVTIGNSSQILTSAELVTGAKFNGLEVSVTANNQTNILNNFLDKYGSVGVKDVWQLDSATKVTQTTADNLEIDFSEATTVLGNDLVFQIGANGGQDQRVSLSVANMDTKHLGMRRGDNWEDGDTLQRDVLLEDISIATVEDANKAIEVITAATNQVSSQRAELGALQNRLEHTLNNLGVTKENLTAAESSIRDVDMAKEMMEFTKNNILVQASQAMLAQANQLPQGVLQLLR